MAEHKIINQDELHFLTFTTNHTEYQFWKQDSHPIELISPKWINQKLDCIHLNPVNAGIVEEAEHYVYSSVWNYAGQ